MAARNLPSRVAPAVVEPHVIRPAHTEMKRPNGAPSGTKEFAAPDPRRLHSPSLLVVGVDNLAVVDGERAFLRAKPICATAAPHSAYVALQIERPP